MPRTSIAGRLAPLLGAAVAALTAPAAEARPKVYAPRPGTELAVPCATRYGAPVFVPKIVAGARPESVVEGAFGARATYGFPENVTIVRDDSAGEPFFRIRYPEGSVAPSVSRRPTGGLGFYAKGNLRSGTEAACLRYLVRFPAEFDFRRGGKLPGLFGGKNPPSGGARPKGDAGFTVRLMWRAAGEGEIYLYAPNMEPSSKNGGEQLGTGAFRFSRGGWTEIQVETVLNTPGEEDGVIGLWVDGRPGIFVKGVRFRRTGRLGVGGLMFSTFFGGDTARFAASKTEHADFAGFRLYGATRAAVLKSAEVPG